MPKHSQPKGFFNIIYFELLFSKSCKADLFLTFAAYLNAAGSSEVLCSYVWVMAGIVERPRPGNVKFV